MIWGLEGRHLWVPPAVVEAFSVEELLDLTDLLSYLLSLGPLFYWAFDRVSGTRDLTGNGFDGTPAGGISIGTGPPLITSDPESSSTRFDGAGEEISLPSYTLARQDYELVGVSDAAYPRPLFGGPADSGIAANLAHAALFDRRLTSEERSRIDALSGAVPVMLNRLIDDNGVKSLPCYKLTKIGGLMGTGESGAKADARVRAEGEIPRRSFRRGKTITYEGLIKARSRSELRHAEAALRGAFADQSTEGLVIVTPHPLYDDSGAYRYFRARALTCDIDDAVSHGPTRVSTRGHESSFVVALRSAQRDGVSYYGETGLAFT
jgi:hypothetical protein